MRIKNKKNKTNYVNFKSSGIAKKIAISAGKTADIPGITNVAQIINYGDFKRGFFEIVSEEPVEVVEKVVKKISKKTSKKTAKKTTKKTTKKKKEEDSLDKVEKEVKDYTDNKDNK